MVLLGLLLVEGLQLWQWVADHDYAAPHDLPHIMEILPALIHTALHLCPWGIVSAAACQEPHRGLCISGPRRSCRDVLQSSNDNTPAGCLQADWGSACSIHT